MSKPTSEEILRTEFCPEFVKLMQDAMCNSYFKYGPVKDGYPDKVNAIESLEERLRQFKMTGNIEFLVDVANFAMIEFMFPAHPEAYYQHEFNGSPGRAAQWDGRLTEGKNSGLKSLRETYEE